MLSAEDTITTPNPWPIRAISLLMIVQAVALISLIAYWVTQFDWDLEMTSEGLSVDALDTALFTAALAPLSIISLLVAVSLFFQQRIAWLAAMILQGLMLFCYLWVYFMTTSYLRQSPWLYALMAFSVTLVLYLNTSDVRTAFLAKPTRPDPDDLAAFERIEGITSVALVDHHHERPVD